jgi:Spy/CpxP family protein refolding chaperone
MRAGTMLACTLALLVAMLVSSQADAQWGRGWGRGSGWQGPRWGGGYGNASGYGSGWLGGRWRGTGPQGRGCLFGPRMAYWLGLTRAQQDAIDTVYLEAMDSARPLLRELDRTEFELLALATAPKYDEKAALGLREKARELDGKLEDVWSKYRQKVRALLTPEQRQQYDDLVVTPGPYGGAGYGPGYGYGGGRGMGWGGRGFWRGRGWGW